MFLLSKKKLLLLIISKMKNLIIVCFCFISTCTIAQKLVNLETKISEKPKSILQSANEKLKLRKIDPDKATFNDWEMVLREIGELTKTENNLFCKLSKTRNITLTFNENKLKGVCEMSEAEDSEKKE